MADLTNIYIVSGVNSKGESFCTVSAHGDDGSILVGQMSTDEIRQHALKYLEVAEGADQDAIVFKVAHKLLEKDAANQFAAFVVTELRNMRNL